MEEEEGDRVGSRKSKDKVVNGEGKRLCRFVEERGWIILNGNVEGDEEGEWTYTGGRGSSVIDYVLGNEDTREKVESMGIGKMVDSDHHPVVVWLMGGRRETSVSGRNGGERACERGNWSEKGRRKFVREFGLRAEGEKGVQEEWWELRERMQGAIGKIGKEGRGRERRLVG